MTVATGRSGVANTPTSSSESAVCKAITSRVAGRIEFAEIAVTFHLEDDGYHGLSNTGCASDVDPRHPREDPPTKPQYVVSLVESPDHNQDTDMF